MKKSYVSHVDQKAKSTCLARHEGTVNSLLKEFGDMDQKIKHKQSFHGDCFAACITLIQLAYNSGEQMWQCRY